MKKILLFSAVLLLLVSCSEKEEPVIADFDAVLSGESPNAKIQLTNKSTGATSYKWNFDKGAPDSVPDKTNVPGLLNITGATHTSVINWQASPAISVASFDSMADDRLLSSLTIIDTNDSFGNQLPCTILFELADHRKGVIKAKAINSARLLADIRIQKY